MHFTRCRQAACPCLPAGRPCHGFHAGTTVPDRIERWWNDSPHAGVGVACGPASLVVIDIDAHSVAVPERNRLLPGIPIHESVNLNGLVSGFDTLALLAALRKQPSPAEDTNTLRVRTPSGGLHVWYRNPSPAIRYRSSTGSSPKVALAWQVDVRAHGGYILAPATRTSQGTYEAVGPTRLPAPLPDWLAAELTRTGHVLTPDRPRTPRAPLPSARAARSPQRAHRVLDPLVAAVSECAATSEGAGFTEKLNRAAFTAGGLVAAGHLDDLAARQLLVNAAETARPWQTARNEKIIHDGLAAGTVRPFHLEGRS
ncbi:bifunctional DNA primase/polymerase [Streptomyces sp. NBC_00654]|uniref:bifunctional DNA primase/polymerase n=1 Tax=Streptomyces sp. NBC_00654 TaxID=2975799 RepID=UPI00225AB523|nr:bifunctional DNA primase/polymerase [Streptomyces sp. NBC_00654]MCX4970845.1 bifunctional DNA primase/polymerase [Streptomyces sp. NBC_00654]